MGSWLRQGPVPADTENRKQAAEQSGSTCTEESSTVQGVGSALSVCSSCRGLLLEKQILLL